MKKFFYFTILAICFSCQITSKNGDNISTELDQNSFWRHLSYLIQLKDDVAEKSWKEFSKRDFFQPTVFYTHEGTFVLHPNDHIQNVTEYQVILPFDQVERIKLSEKYTDTINFNFSMSFTDTDSTALHFNENVLYFQSFDLTSKLIGVNDLQDWSIMVIHELFHGYQSSIQEFNTYSTQLEIPGGPDEFLGKYHAELNWYKESIHKENELLKGIWINDADLIESLKQYDSLRTIRIEKIRNTYGVDIREIEDYEILIEGNARYFESLCKRQLAISDPDTSMLSKNDLGSIHHMFEGYDIKKDKGLYNIYNHRYYYQLGFNISMILEKYLPEYKASIYGKEHNFNPYIEALKTR